MSDLADLFHAAAEHAARYRESLPGLPTTTADPAAVRAAFGGPLPRAGLPAGDVLEQLVAAAGPGLLASSGPRYFGFVIGGALPRRWPPTSWPSAGTRTPSTRCCRRPRRRPRTRPGPG